VPERPNHLRPVYLLGACRTPFQRVATGFLDLMSCDLAAVTLRGLRRRYGFESVDRVIFGATVSNPRTTNVAREAALLASLPAEVPAITLTAAGASATLAICHGADLIATGQAEVVVAGGSDCISDPPIGYGRAMRQKLVKARRLRGLVPRLRFLLSLRPWDFLPDLPDVREFSSGQTMGEWTEELARELGISRQDQDAYALESHRRAAAAAAHLAAEIEPVTLASGEVVRHDNGIRAETTLAQLAALPPAFGQEGTLTAGNSSFLTDGAAAVLLASEGWARQHDAAPKARLAAHLLTAHDPRRDLLLGPAFALPRLLDREGLTLGDIDVFEIHEAFAAQMLALRHLLARGELAHRRLGLAAPLGEIPSEKLNSWGGSLAIGNPFAPNGARLVGTALSRLESLTAPLGSRGGRAIVATCAGGGLGHALLLEKE